jgi:hypothetical protein
LLLLQCSAGNRATTTARLQRNYAPRELPVLALPPEDATAAVEVRDAISIVFDRPLTLGQAMLYVWPSPPSDSSILRPDPSSRVEDGGFTRFRLELAHDDPHVAETRWQLVGSMRFELKWKYLGALERWRRDQDQRNERRESQGEITGRLAELSARVQGELEPETEFGERARFQVALNEFRSTLEQRLAGVAANEPLPPDLRVVMEALIIWQRDTGEVWGEAPNVVEKVVSFLENEVGMTSRPPSAGPRREPTTRNLRLSAPEYAVIPQTQPKCSAYVAEVVYRALGLVHKAHEETEWVASVPTGDPVKESTGKYFPYQANQWGDEDVQIPSFRVVAGPEPGDIWSDGHHVGVYLGEYAGIRLYVSARLDPNGVFGLGLQQEEGVQIKCLKPGGIFRRYMP